MTPAVSVVIPCFNLGSYLDEAVQSVLAQTRTDAEILIVDDGSDDPVTTHLLASYRRPRTRIIRTPNRGLSSARNTGLEEARGRYVSFLDADDLFEPRFLEATIGRLEADDSLAFASCWLTAFGARQFSWQPERCDFPWLLAEDTVCTAAPVRRDALLAIGGFDERPGLDGYEDWALAVDLVERGHRGEIVPEPLFRYRIRPGSMSSETSRPRNHMRVFETMMEKHADSYAAHAPGVLAAIHERIAALEAQFPDAPPPRPQLDGEPWRTAIPRLERHRCGLEQALVEAHGAAEDALSAEASVGAGAAVPVAWGSLRRLEPVSRVWGLDRGQPVDRYYIEGFLERHAADIAGDVLEVKDPGYVKRFERGARSFAVLDVAAHNEQATLVADLTQPDALPAGAFDCIVLTQTLHLLFELETAVANLHRALAPGGVVLVTAPCVSRIDYESGVVGDFWRFTAASAQRLFARRFGAEGVTVEALGNVLACTAFLHGLAREDLDAAELDHHDPYFPLLLAVRAVKQRADGSSTARKRAIEGRLDEAACGALSGWAFDRAAPWRRLKLDVWEDERRVGTVWSDGFRPDLAKAGKGKGDVAFRFAPDAPLHGDPPPRVRVVPAGDDETPLPDGPRPVRCDCTAPASGPAPGLRGAALDLPAAGAALPFPWLEIAGWAVGEQAPVEAVELLWRGERFRRVALAAPRPDLAGAFPDCAWAARAGFAARGSLAGSGGGAAELDVVAVLGDGRCAPIGRIAGEVAPPPAIPVTVLLDPADARVEDCTTVLGQDAPATRVLVQGGAEPLGHPGLHAVHGRSAALDVPDAWGGGAGHMAGGGGPPNGLVWLADGHEDVAPGFLAAAAAALSAQPAAAFAVAAAPGAEAPADALVGVLSGTALGAALLLRASALQAIGGIDEGATTVPHAQWDLAIRLAEAGYGHVAVPALADGGTTLAERAGDEAVRTLYRKHAHLYEPRLRAVLLERERLVGALLRESHLAERELEERLRPQLRARRRERDRLGRKLRGGPQASVALTDPDPRSSGEDPWGDLRRLEPLSPFWGEERGLVVDRVFIERFLAEHADDVRGRVLAYHDTYYATRYGRHRLRDCDVLDADATNPAATVVADLQRAPRLASDRYDCVLLPHVLQLLEEPAMALAECARVLRPGGVLLATVPAAGRIELGSPRTDYWRFSPTGFAELAGQAFGAANVAVAGHGGTDATLAFLAGLAAEELEQGLLEGDADEPPLVISARATKPEAA